MTDTQGGDVKFYSYEKGGWGGGGLLAMLKGWGAQTLLG